MSPRVLLGLAATVALVGCAGPNIGDAVQRTNRAAADFTKGSLQLARTQQEREERRKFAGELLSKPLTMDAAVQLALANSPAVQSLIAQSWNDMAQASQYGRIANPVFTFDRLRVAHELEIDRLLTFGLLDLLTLPKRMQIARNEQEQANMQLTVNIVDQVSRIRAAWVRAVAAQQSEGYAQQVRQAAEAGAELARRMQQVGNFSKLQRAREHAFYADAATQLAAAHQNAIAAREELVRALGLTDSQARELTLPARLPDLPAKPRTASEVSSAAGEQRLDVQLARLQLDVAGKAQGLSLLKSVANVEAGVQHDTVFADGPGGTRANHGGYELSIRLPIFDWGGAQRAAMNAQSLAAANRYDSVVRSASSQLRQSYAAYRGAYDIAVHYRDEVVPVRKAISDENMLRYNGMLVGVFELLADARDQIATVRAAIDAQQQFWLADATLSSSLIGSPLTPGATAIPATGAGRATSD